MGIANNPGERKNFIESVMLRVTEIPDRNSPDDQPEMMLVTDKELRNILNAVLDELDKDFC